MQTTSKKSGFRLKKSEALKLDDPAQSRRFREAAHKAEADETNEGAERAFKKAVVKRP